MKKIATIGLLSAALLVPTIGVSLSATAQEATSEKQAKAAITFRKSVFQLLRANIGPLGAMAKGEIPYDEAVMAKNAERMAQLAAMVPDYLAMDTTKFNDGSEALPKIWQNRDDVNEKANALLEASVALQAVVASKDESGYRKAIGNVGGTCKGCHDDYKAD